MARLIPNPQALVEQLLRLATRHPEEPVVAGPDTDQRILDAALAAFSARGLRATTMTQIARDAGVSREWVYRRFTNRDGVILAVTRREVVRLIDGLVAHVFDTQDVTEAVTEAFVYGVEFLRDHELLQRVLSAEADTITPSLLREAAPVVGLAVRTGAGYLTALGDIPHDDAVMAAEAIVRLAATIVFVPHGVHDLHDPDELRRFARATVPALLHPHLEPG